MLNLFDFGPSSAARRVRIALHLKGLPFQSTSVHLLEGEQHASSYMAVNSQELVPTLETPQGMITQSLAIIEYLDDLHPNPPLLPREPIDRARVRAMALAIATDTHPIQNLRVLNYLRDKLNHDEATAMAWARHWVDLGLKAFQDLSDHAPVSGQYSYGDQVTLADIILIPQMVNARRFSCDLTKVPRLMEIETALMKLPAFFETVAKR